jgi:Mn2+/Fe2+ NRAMP family transporter
MLAAALFAAAAWAAALLAVCAAWASVTAARRELREHLENDHNHLGIGH